MPANRLSFAVTDAYRDEALALRGQAGAVARTGWGRIDRGRIADSYENFLTPTVSALTAIQGAAVRLAAAYATAYLASELGEPVEAVEAFDTTDLVGRSRDGRRLEDALRSPLIAVLYELPRTGPDNAVRRGLNRAVFMAQMAADHATREALSRAIKVDERFVGYARAVKGTCGACIAVAGRYPDGIHFQVHPNCKCVQEPIVRGVRDRFPRPTAEQIFAAKTAAEQDQALGPTVAEAVRNGTVALSALVAESELAEEPNFITQATA